MSDTLWVADNSPYDLVADLVIPHGITLMIQAGVTVNGHHHTIQNQGTLCFMAPSYPSTVLINTPISSSGRILLNGTFQSTSVNTYEIVHTTNSNGMMSASEVIEVNENASHTFVVDKPAGEYIRNVVVDGISLGPLSSYTFDAVHSDHTIAVELSDTEACYVTVTTGSGGTAAPSGVVPVDKGGSLGISIQPDANSHIADVKVDGQSVGAVRSYTLANVTTDHAIEASFTADRYVIAVSGSSGGSISPSGRVAVDPGDSKTFTVTPNSGYKISDVKVDGLSHGPISSYTFANMGSDHTLEAVFEKVVQPLSHTIIVLQIGSPTLAEDGVSRALDSPPVIKNGRTLVPIRAIIEALGGTLGWDAVAKKATVALGTKGIALWIGKGGATVNGVSTPIDAANPNVVPEIINGRTMLPLRFVAENLGATVSWDAGTQTITITY
jgi:hypothetical protein